VKALGYPNRYLVGLVLREALLLSVMGFVPGVIISWVMYGSVAAVTGLPLDLTAWRGTVVLILTVAMCTISGIAAMRKALSADPAELFG
jgi:putative ABC transport system permease protein